MPDFFNEMVHLTGRDVLDDKGIVCYMPNVLPKDRASESVEYLGKNIHWYHQSFYGKLARRGTAFFADRGVVYRYTGQEVIGKGWDAVVDSLRRELESITRVSYNSVLMHRYPDGKAQMGWHSDDERELGQNPVIASLSFGASRQFKLRHKRSRVERSYTLEHNSLLVMAGSLQHYWQHCVPSRANVNNERFNLTFRYTIPTDDKSSC